MRIRESISVCMASYNGSKYIEIQIESILSQLILGDELIIVDDCSTDNTVDIIEDFNSDFIKLFKNEKNIGYVKTFEKSLYKAENKYICLTDQDDIWIDGRMQKLEETIVRENVLLVVSNFKVNCESDKCEKKFSRLDNKDSTKNLNNIIEIFKGKSAYYGCTMIMNKDILKYILPFPSYTEAHDLWITITANMLKSICHLEDNTLIYRIHDNNSSLKKRKLVQKLKARYYFCKKILIILKRINKI